MNSLASLVMNELRILSIQSHVVHGYVGNKCAVFPLQLFGYDVDIINTVQFSNHTGYKTGFSGSKMNADDFNTIHSCLVKNDLLSPITHILQGYCPSSDLLLSIHNSTKLMKDKNPDLFYLCDPVMGDHNKLYVSKELVDVYKNIVVPSSQFVIPNQYEAELLTDCKIKSENDAIKACNILHDKGVETVVITSLYYSKDNIILLGSSRKPSDNCCFTLTMPQLPHYYTGTGDLFGSLLLGWYLKHPNNVTLACEKAVSGIRSVILNTANYQEKVNKLHPELRIIQSRNDIENPKITIQAKAILK